MIYTDKTKKAMKLCFEAHKDHRRSNYHCCPVARCGERRLKLEKGFITLLANYYP